MVISICLSLSLGALVYPYFSPDRCSWSSTSFPSQVLQLHWLWGTHSTGLGQTTNVFCYLKVGRALQWAQACHFFSQSSISGSLPLAFSTTSCKRSLKEQEGDQQRQQKTGCVKADPDTFPLKRGRKMMDFSGCTCPFFLKP